MKTQGTNIAFTIASNNENPKCEHNKGVKDISVENHKP